MLSVEILKEVVEKAEEYGERYARLTNMSYEFSIEECYFEFSFSSWDDSYDKTVEFEEFIEYCNDPDGCFAPLEKEVADKKAKVEEKKKKDAQRKEKNKLAREKAQYKKLKKKFEK